VTAVGGIVLVGGAIYWLRTQEPEANFDAARNAAVHTASEAASELAGKKKINSRAGEKGINAHRAE